MNWEQMKKNVGCRVQLVPTACQLDGNGRELPRIDDDWIIEEVSTATVRVFNIRTEHITILGKDHIYNFTSNPARSQTGVRYGFLTLNVQVFLQGNEVRVRPTTRHGEAVKPEPVEVIEKWVDFMYPFDSGLQWRLEAAGYCVSWCLDTELSRKIDLEGCEIVVEPDAQGVLTKFRLRGGRTDQTLIKIKK